MRSWSTLLGEVVIEMVAHHSPPKLLHASSEFDPEEFKRELKATQPLYRARTPDGAPLVGLGESSSDAITDLERQYRDAQEPPVPAPARAAESTALMVYLFDDNSQDSCGRSRQAYEYQVEELVNEVETDYRFVRRIECPALGRVWRRNRDGTFVEQTET